MVQLLPQVSVTGWSREARDGRWSAIATRSQQGSHRLGEGVGEQRGETSCWVWRCLLEAMGATVSIPFSAPWLGVCLYVRTGTVGCEIKKQRR